MQGKKKDFPPAAVPLLFWSSRFTLTPQRFSTVVFTLNAHSQVSLKNKKMWLLHSKKERSLNRLCHKYVQLYLHALCSWLWRARGRRGLLLPQCTLCTKQGSFPLCHNPIIQGFSVCLFTNHSKLRKAHLTKWNDLNLYSCLQLIPMSKQRRKQKKSYAWNVLWVKIYILCKKLMLL